MFNQIMLKIKKVRSCEHKYDKRMLHYKQIYVCVYVTQKN